MQIRSCRFRFVATFLLSCGTCVAAYPQENSPRHESIISLLRLSLSAGIEYPIESGYNLLELGGYADLAGNLPLPFLPWLSVGANLSYSFLPVRAETSISMLTLGVGPMAVWEISPRFSAHASLDMGGYYGFFNQTALDPTGTAYDGQQGGNAFLSLGAGMSYFLTPFLSVGAQVSGFGYFGLLPGVRATLATTFHLDGLNRKVRFEGIQFLTLFPALHAFYASGRSEAAIGQTVLRNLERFPIENAEISLFAPGLMQSPTACVSVPRLQAGAQAPIELHAVLSENVLAIAESTSVNAEISVEYTLNGARRRRTVYEQLALNNRNAITWDDSAKVAAFISVTDPVILTLGKQVAGMVRSMGPKAIDQNMRMGMGMIAALAAHGLNYVVDPNTASYADASRSATAVDFVQFPRQTLLYRGGDCDDLTVLFCALMEAVGVETAFVLVPGHIYGAFALDLKPEEAKSTFSSYHDLIIAGDQAWVPVETTLLAKGFLQAWSEGSREWRGANLKGQEAKLIPTHAAWGSYGAAGFPLEETSREMPTVAKITELYGQELGRLVTQELQPLVSELQQRIAQSKAKAKEINKLGVVYAQYGLMDKARAEFNRALQNGEYVPALVNLANLALLDRDFERAKKLCQRAARSDPDSASVLLGLARAHYELGEYDQVRQYYELAVKKNPAAAGKLSYLAAAGSSTEARAEDAARQTEVMIWESER